MATKTKAKRPASTKPKLPAKYAWLRKMRALLVQDGKWLKGCFEHDGAYCVVGARALVDGVEPQTASPEVLTDYRYEVESALNIKHAYDWNDSHTQKQVIARIDAAIRRLSR